MASIFQGPALPDVSVTQGQTTTAPSWYTDYLSNLASQGSAAAANAKFVGATPLQQQAFDLTKANVGAYQPALQSAINMAQRGATTTAPSVINQYMDPYTSNVVSEIGRLGQRNITQNLAPGAVSGAVGTGQFGSKRGAEVLGNTLRDAMADIGGRQSMALSQGYQNAMASAQADLNRQLLGSQQMGNLAASQQALGLGDINALGTMGAQQQAIKQAEQLFPLQTLANSAALLRGYTVPTSVSSTYKGPLPGAYAPSPLQQIAGLGALLSAQTGGGSSIGGLLGKGFSSIWDKIFSPSTSSSSDFGGFFP
jgi:hypothetical protein